LSLHVACSSSSIMAADCAVMLTSLAVTNRPADLTVHFMYDETLNRIDLDRLGTLVRGHGMHWHPICVPDCTTRQFPYSERYGSNVWYRILLPELLPDLDRVLYLDSDLLIVDELQTLFDMSLDGACLAAVTQPIPPYMLARLQNTLGVPDGNSYFNTGVMTLALGALREGDFVDQVLTVIDERLEDLPWVDQDALNAVLHSRWLRLKPRWNVMTPVFDLHATQLPWSRDEIRDAITSPAAIHFIGPYKPWHYRCRHPFRKSYFEYLARTPWRDRSIEGRTLLNMLVRPMPLRWQPRIDASLDRGTARLHARTARLRALATTHGRAEKS
jgi:lipopolysaccharide biosynthesis glycosyltransferase